MAEIEILQADPRNPNSRSNVVVKIEPDTRYALILDEYELVNLHWMLQHAWNGTAGGEFNTGDWIGQIPGAIENFFNQVNVKRPTMQPNGNPQMDGKAAGQIPCLGCGKKRYHEATAICIGER